MATCSQAPVRGAWARKRQVSDSECPFIQGDRIIGTRVMSALASSGTNDADFRLDTRAEHGTRRHSRPATRHSRSGTSETASLLGNPSPAPPHDPRSARNWAHENAPVLPPDRTNALKTVNFARVPMHRELGSDTRIL